jgi:hypothetical protein
MPHGPLNIKRSTGDAALRSHFHPTMCCLGDSTCASRIVAA